MSQTEELVKYIQSISPDCYINIDSPKKAGSSWIDIRLKGKTIVVELKSTQGFGVSLISNDDLGSLFGGPENVFLSLEATKSYIKQLIETQGLGSNNDRY